MYPVNEGLSQRFSAPLTAVLACAVGAMQPRDAHPRAELKFFCVDAHIFNYADDLMAGNQQRFPRGEFAFNHMKIGAADTTIADANQDFVFGRLRVERRQGRADSFRSARVREEQRLSYGFDARGHRT